MLLEASARPTARLRAGMHSFEINLGRVSDAWLDGRYASPGSESGGQGHTHLVTYIHTVPCTQTPGVSGLCTFSRYVRFSRQPVHSIVSSTNERRRIAHRLAMASAPNDQTINRTRYLVYSNSQRRT